MDILEEKKPLASFPTPHHHPPPPPAMRMPPPLDTSQHPAAVAVAAAAATPSVGQGIYEPSPWRPYPSSFDPHVPDQHRVSTAASNPSQQPPPIPPSSHAYPVIPNRELPQLPPDGPYGRPNSLPGPVTTPPDAHPHPHHPHPHHHPHHPHHPHHHAPPPSGPPPPAPSAPASAHPAAHPPSHSSAGNYRLNGSGAAGGPAPPPPPSLQDPSPPHSAPPEYRSRMAFPPEQPANGDASTAAAAAASAAIPAHSIPPAQYSTPAVPQTPTPFDPPGYYNSSAYGLRQRKAARAQQACDQCRARKAKCDEGRPSCSHCKENNLPCVYKEVPPHKYVSCPFPSCCPSPIPSNRTTDKKKRPSSCSIACSRWKIAWRNA